MALASPPTSIADLRRWIERLERGHVAGCLPFGSPAIDANVPDGGLALGHLHEVSEGGFASQYAGLAALFTAGMVARLTGPVLWCLRGRDLFAPALARVGLGTDRVIYCETWKDCEVLPAIEEGLRCKGLAAVVGELTRLSLTASRRLQLAASESGVTAFVIRRWHNAVERAEATAPSASSTRWRVSPSPSPQAGLDGLYRQHWHLELLRARGGEPHSWIVEACDAAGYLALPAAVGERSPAADGQKRALAG
jgi:protein ImuA